MSLNNEILEKLDLIDTVPVEFINAVEKMQPLWAVDLENLINELGFTGGRLNQDAENLAKIAQIKDAFLLKIMNDEGVYREALREYAKQFLKQRRINDSIFAQTFDSVDVDTDFLDEMFKTSRRNAIKLFDADSIVREFIDPIGNTLTESVSTGGTHNDLIKTLRNFIEGDEERLGQYRRYVGTYAKDSFSTFDRSYTQALVKEYGGEWIRYLGGKVRDSRQFCIDRDGKFFHIKEVELWGEGVGVGDAGFPWQGMNKNTNPDTIKNFCGGYNCNHSLVYVVEADVPDEVKERAKEKGYV